MVAKTCIQMLIWESVFQVSQGVELQIVRYKGDGLTLSEVTSRFLNINKALGRDAQGARQAQELTPDAKNGSDAAVSVILSHGNRSY